MRSDIERTARRAGINVNILCGHSLVSSSIDGDRRRLKPVITGGSIKEPRIRIDVSDHGTPSPNIAESSGMFLSLKLIRCVRSMDRIRENGVDGLDTREATAMMLSLVGCFQDIEYLFHVFVAFGAIPHLLSAILPGVHSNPQDAVYRSLPEKPCR